jgi:tetratricopeptide (TPR) repeat protein
VQDSLPAVAPTVFISYSHDSQEHLDRVLAFANRLRVDGIDAAIDQYEVSPPEGWPVWMERQVRESDFVLVICTETYLKRAERREDPGKGHGVIWESVLTYQQIYDAGSKNEKFIPVLLEGGKRPDIPLPLRSATSYECATEEGYWELYARLTGQHGKSKPQLGKLKALPAREKKDHSSAPAAAVQPAAAQAAKTPAFWNVPHDRNLVFTGRSEILESLRRDLAESSRQALYGLGGIGKTQVAVEYAYRHRLDYIAVLWAFADSEQSFSTSFVQIAKTLNLPIHDYPEQTVIVGAVKRWLEQNEGWLLVLDNVDPQEMLRPFLPQPGHGHVLLTSRAHDFQALSIFKPLEIIELPPEAAREFLLKRTGRDAGSADKAEIDSLTRELGYFPLALEQAGAFIHENQTSFDDYLKSFRKRRIALLEQHVPVMGGYKGTVATTWAINFAEVEKTPASADLLRLSAFLAPILIPFELLERGKAELGETLGSKLEQVADDPVLLGNILTPLTSYSLIRRNNATRSYSIHPLVQEVVRANMSAEVQRFWTERTVRALSAAFPDPEEFKNWVNCERLLSHALICAKYVTDCNLESAAAATLLRNTGYYLFDRGQFRQAEPFLDSALKIREKVCGPEHPDTADSLSKVALLYSEKGKYPDAEALEQRALKIRENSLGAEHSDTATSVHNLAGIFRNQAKYVEAELLFQRALQIKEKVLGPEHRETLINLSNIASLYTLQGRYTEAELLHKKVLAIRQKTLGLEDPETAMSLSNLAYHYHTQERYQEAEVLNKQALAIQERWLGQEHPSTATSLHNVAWLYHYQGKLEEAEVLSRRVLEIREKILGPEHPDVAESLKRLAAVLEAERRTEEAERLEQRALKILETALGDHPATASSLGSLANLYLTQGRYRPAEPLFLRSLTIREKTLGSAHPDTLISLRRLAFLYRKWGRPRDAVKYERQLKKLQKKKRK